MAAGVAVLPTYVFDERFLLGPDDPGNQLVEPMRTIFARCRGRAHLLRKSAKWCLAGVFAALIIGVGAVIGASWLASFDIEQALGEDVVKLIKSKRSEIQGIEERLKAADLNVETIRRRIEEDLGHAVAVWDQADTGFKRTFYAVYFLADGRAGWAVGREGTILATADGGETWEPRTSGTKERLYGVQFLADGRAGWAVGGGGTILVSRRQEPVPAVPSIEPNSDALIQFLSKNPPPSLFMAPVYKEQLENQIEESKELERTREQLVTEIQAFQAGAGGGKKAGTQGATEDGKSSISFLTNTTAIRAGIIVLILFLVQILVHLSRYNTRLAGFYGARADVLLLIGEKQWVKERPTVAEVLEMMDAFSPDRLDFGKAPATAVSRIANLARSVTSGGSRA